MTSISRFVGLNAQVAPIAGGSAAQVNRGAPPIANASYSTIIADRGKPSSLCCASRPAVLSRTVPPIPHRARLTTVAFRSVRVPVYFAQIRTLAAALLLSFVLAASLTGCAELADNSVLPNNSPTTTARAEAPTTLPDPAWAQIDKALERKGVVRDGIEIITVPRNDLDVAIDGMGIPTGAGIESIFYFYRCPCGKMNVVGQFVTTDYEANDVVDALRKNAAMQVASVGPLLLYEKPRLLVVRFQGEGEPAMMASVLREAIRWTGKERLAAEPLPTRP